MSANVLNWCGARHVARLAKDVRGTSAVEFGLLAFPFLGLICAVFEIAYVNFENTMLGAGVDRAARAMLTGKTQAANITTASQFVSTYLCPRTGTRLVPSNFDCSKLVVDVRPASTFSAADLTNAFYKATNNKFCPGAPGQILVMRVAYPLPAILPLNLFQRANGLVNDVPGQNGWYHILMGSALFQEEVFTTGFTAAPGC